MAEKRTYFACHGPPFSRILRSVELYAKRYVTPNLSDWDETPKPQKKRKKVKPVKIGRGLMFSLSIGSASQFDGRKNHVCYLVQPVEILIYGAVALLAPYCREEDFTINVIEGLWQLYGFVKAEEGLKHVSLLYDANNRKGTLSLS